MLATRHSYGLSIWQEQCSYQFQAFSAETTGFMVAVVEGYCRLEACRNLAKRGPFMIAYRWAVRGFWARALRYRGKSSFEMWNGGFNNGSKVLSNVMNDDEQVEGSSEQLDDAAEPQRLRRATLASLVLAPRETSRDITGRQQLHTFMSLFIDGLRMSTAKTYEAS